MLARLKVRAAALSTSASALAARYIDEGLRADEHPLIVFRNRAGARRAMLAGTRLNVADVVETAKAAGSADATAESLDLPLARVRAALGYYSEFRDEIDAEIELDRRVAEREEARWRREQTALA